MIGQNPHIHTFSIIFPDYIYITVLNIIERAALYIFEETLKYQKKEMY